MKPQQVSDISTQWEKEGTWLQVKEVVAGVISGKQKSHPIRHRLQLTQLN